VKFLIYSSNYSPELTGIGKYNGEMAQRLTENDVETHVITAPPYYPEWKRHHSYKNTWSKSIDENGVIVHRAPMYVPQNVSVPKRVLHLASFSISSIVHLLKLLFIRPDVIFVVQPTLFCAPAALLYGLITGAKTIMHIQDFELDAMLGLGMSNGGRRWAPARWLERFILRRFDHVSSISFSMLDKAKSRGVEDHKLLFFPNWADTGFVTPEASGDELRSEWGYSQDDQLILYSGNLGNKQGLEIVLDAAEKFTDRPNVQFLIVGAGTSKEKLQKEAEKRGLKNVKFKPLQPYESLPNLLAAADIHLVVQRIGAADAVLPSKLANILSCGGHALVTAETSTELGRIHNHYPGIFHKVEPENLDEFVGGIEILLSKNLKEVNLVAWRYAVDHLNKNTVIDRFLREIQSPIDFAQVELAKDKNSG
jgi:colanic acid biosynthesis glycosyl transferase WcaI